MYILIQITVSINYPLFERIQFKLKTRLHSLEQAKEFA